MTNLKSQSGRSMVEMLGVLAIIGVLSIGGIAGYTMAMNRYKANEILSAAAQVAVVGQTADMGNGRDADLSDIGLNDVQNVTVSYKNAAVDGGDTAGTITLAAVSGTTVNDGVWTAISSIIGGDSDDCTKTQCKLKMENGRLVPVAYTQPQN